MVKPTKGPRLGGGPAHERLMLANLAAALFTHKSITTTETRAKRLRPFAERLITFAKRGDLHARRRVLRVLNDPEVVHILFTEIAPLMEEREGGYTRITKLGYRKGDNASMARIELVLEPVTKKPKREKTAEAVATEPADVEVSEAEMTDVEETAPQTDAEATGSTTAEAAAEQAEAAGETVPVESTEELAADAEAIAGEDATAEEPAETAAEVAEDAAEQNEQ